MLINELAARTGLSIHTLRYYENLGLFQGAADASVKSNNYKHYEEGHVTTLTLIKEAKSVGFTLAEIRQLLQLWSSPGLPVEKKLAFADRKIRALDEKIRQLKLVKSRLQQMRQTIAQGQC